MSNSTPTLDCLNCGRTGPLIRGRCNACYLYLYRTGRERPAELISGHGRCECGQPAGHLVEITVGSGGPRNRLKREWLDLCEECARYESRAGLVGV